MRTWGGAGGHPGLPGADGWRRDPRRPNLGFWTADGFGVENVGVPPDIEVEQWPAEVIAGKDPQLEKAIEIILKELEANPPKELKRPPFPVRVHNLTAGRAGGLASGRLKLIPIGFSTELKFKANNRLTDRSWRCGAQNSLQQHQALMVYGLGEAAQALHSNRREAPRVNEADQGTRFVLEDLEEVF